MARIRTYTVKAGDYLLGVRLPRKRAIDLMFATGVAGYSLVKRMPPISRADWGYSLDSGEVDTTLPNGLVVKAYRDDDGHPS